MLLGCSGSFVSGNVAIHFPISFSLFGNFCHFSKNSLPEITQRASAKFAEVCEKKIFGNRILY